MAFAENTSVSVEKSQAEIKKILSRYGATKTATAEDMDTGSACIQFVANDRLIKFVLTLPTKMEKRFIQDGRGKTRSIPAIEAVWEQACRQKWRALCLCIKAPILFIFF